MMQANRDRVLSLTKLYIIIYGASEGGRRVKKPQGCKVPSLTKTIQFFYGASEGGDALRKALITLFSQSLGEHVMFGLARQCEPQGC